MQIDRLVRSKRKTVAIFVGGDGSVEVRAPLRVPLARIQAFVDEKAGWIRQKQAEAVQQQEAGVRRFRSGGKFPYLGKVYPLRVVTWQRSALELEGGRFCLKAGSLPRARQVFEGWYRARARQVLAQRVQYWAARMGVKPGSLRIGSARTRWGSCSSRGTLSFPWRLVLAPPEIVDYVVVHELAHLAQRNHSPAFWAVVAGAMPDYKQRRKWLKQHGGELSPF